MTLNRVRVSLTGVGGLPGVSTFYFDSTTVDMTALRTFWVAVAAYFPTAVTIAVPNAGDQFQEATGLITGTWTGPAQATVPGSGGVGAYSSTSGAMIRWTPNGVVDGRRPIGKTFIVPGTAALLSTSGTVPGAAVTALTNAATALLTAYGGSMKLWHRKNAKGAGQQLTILSGACSNKQVVLRSRRD
jgi:hypothetical protein